MKRAALILAALAAILTAAAAPVRTATENFVANKIAEAVAAIPAPDYSTNNTELVETIRAKAPAPGNYAVVSNAAIYAAITNALQDAALSNKLDKSGGTVTGALTVQENLTVGDGSATGAYSVAEGYGMAEGDYSHAEGHNTITTVFGIDAHAEGSSTTANGYASHVEGGGTTANGEYSHAEGEDTTAQNDAEHAQGRFNTSHKSSGTFGDAGNTLSSIGFGTADSTRKNAVETMQDGKTFIYGLGGYDGTNPTNGVKDLVAAIEGKADAADIPEWAKAPAKPTYTASEVGAYSTTAIDAILQGYLPLDYFQNGQTIPMYWGDGTKLCDFGANWLGNLANTVSEKPDDADIPPAVSNIVTTALVRERLGVYLYVGEDGGIYVHTNED
jgi:hypothetical protein